MAKNDREIWSGNYVDRWYPCVTAGLACVDRDGFLQLFKCGKTNKNVCFKKVHFYKRKERNTQ